ncbi:MAG: DUF3658 domain-containing protein [Zoogloeaceae bacterium]|nr:DUF3658 domain-containing protein [Zoogloeaceae bacterium]
MPLLLLYDEYELPDLPGEEEQALALELGAEGLNRIDEAIMSSAKAYWQKVARVIHDAIKAGNFSCWDAEAVGHLHTRRVMELVASGALEAQGYLGRPRFSEVRIPNAQNQH